MGEYIRELIAEEKVDARIREMGTQISNDYQNGPIYLVTVLKGGAFFATELAKRITVPTYIDFITASSYGSGTVSSGNVSVKKDLSVDVHGKNVLIVEDIIDSGNTLCALLKYFKEKGAKTVKAATLLDKPDRREVEVDVAYTGFAIPDEFVVGYGLDYDQKYRNLPYVGVLEFD